jgi:hypothetical protein
MYLSAGLRGYRPRPVLRVGGPDWLQRLPPLPHNPATFDVWQIHLVYFTIVQLFFDIYSLSLGISIYSLSSGTQFFFLHVEMVLVGLPAQRSDRGLLF